MKKTRNLFILAGSDDHISVVLNELHFKGLITFLCGITVTDPMILEAFKNNKSVVCSANHYSGNLISQAITIRVMEYHPDLSSNGVAAIILDDTDYAVQFENIANNFDCDIGDHKSNSSGLNGAPTTKDCAYCRYLAGFPADNERTVYQSENFFVLPTVGQFIKGSLLVIPYQHIVSNAEMDPSLLGEFEDVLADVEYLIRLTYNPPGVLTWENGTGSGGIGKAKDSIVHSHVHIYPSSLTSEDIKKVSGFAFETITLHDLKFYTEHSYLLIRNPDYKTWIINNNPNLYIPRQYVRQLVAEEHNISGDGWNWRTNHFSNNMYQTVEDIRDALKENWPNVPERVQKNTSFLL